MSWYADAHLSMSEPEDYGEKECWDCDNGSGEVEDGYDDFGEIIYTTCPTCNGSGTIPKDADDAASDEWDAKCED